MTGRRGFFFALAACAATLAGSRALPYYASVKYKGVPEQWIATFDRATAEAFTDAAAYADSQGYANVEWTHLERGVYRPDVRDWR